MAQKRGEEPFFPPNADVGYRSNNALTGQDDPIIVPKDATELLQYEGELVVVFGKKCKNVSEEQALDYVLGYTIGNDVSERTWQRRPAEICTNLWLCPGCWERVKREDDERYFEHHPV